MAAAAAGAAVGLAGAVAAGAVVGAAAAGVVGAGFGAGGAVVGCAAVGLEVGPQAARRAMPADVASSCSAARRVRPGTRVVLTSEMLG